MKNTIILFLSLAYPLSLFPLRISEVYYGGNLLIPDEERYIELENDESEPIDMRKVTLIIPRSDTTTISNSLLQGNFLLFGTEAKTNEWILFPGQRAVIISEDYNAGGRLLSWDTNTLLFKPRSKTAWTYSWNNRLHLLALLYNGQEVFRASDIPSSIQEKGKALVWNNGWKEDCPRPGQTKKIKIHAPYVLSTGERVEIRIESEYPLSELIVEEYPSSSQARYTLSGSPPYFLVLSGSFYHATTWILRAGNAAHKIRFLDTNLSSPLAGKILISEIVSDPTRDYSGGGWTGQDGGGTINENDDWIEIANTTDQFISFSNWYIEHTTSQTKSYRALKLRFDNKTGRTSNSLLSPQTLGILSIENGIANQASIILYDGHPLWGKRVAILSYGEDKIPAARSNNEEKSLQRLPHNASDDIAEWRLFSPTYGKINGNSPYLITRWSPTNRLLLEIVMSDPEKEDAFLSLVAKSEIDEKPVFLKNYQGCFRGYLSITRTNHPEALSVKNGGKNFLLYTNQYGTSIWNFVWKEDGWNYPSSGESLSQLVIYPNPALRKSRVFLSRLIKNAKIVIFDQQGRVIEELTSQGEDYIVWNTPEKSGLFCVLVMYGGQSVYRWVLVK
ncbi:MAG: T9SS type A sorting domain-containing protein [Brevinematales bacterium]